MAFDMGMDFGQLANIARPQMMPNAPLGSGAMAGLDYGEQRNRQDMLLLQATEQAKKEAEYKAALANEQISPEAIAARKSELNMPALKEQQQRLAIQKLQEELAKNENRPIEEAANIYGDNKDLEGALEHMRAKGKMDLKGHTFGIPGNEKKDGMILAGIRKAGVDTAGFSQKMQLKELDNEGKLSVAALRAASEEDKNRLRLEVSKELQKARLAAQASIAAGKPTKPPNSLIAVLGQLSNRMIEDPSLKPTLQPEYDRVLADINNINEHKAVANTAAQADIKAAQVKALTNGKVNMPGGTTSRAPAPATAPSSYSSAEDVGNALRSGKISLDQAKKELLKFGYK